MNRKQRLEALLGGNYADLVQLDTGRQAQLPKVTPPAPQPVAPAKDAQVPAKGKEGDDADEEDFDEYLKSVGNASGERRARRSRIPSDGVAGEGVRLSLENRIMEDTNAAKFCPLIAVSRFPYKYLHGKLSESVAKGFFDQGKFFRRTWDLWYIYPPTSVSTGPIILVPLRQVEGLLTEINEALRGKFSIPVDQEAGFLIEFAAEGLPTPKFLGVSRSRERKDELVARIPPPMDDVDLIPPGCTGLQFDAYSDKLRHCYEATRNKKSKSGGKGGKGSKGSKSKDPRTRMREWAESLRRTQCYLGLRPPRKQGISAPGPQQGSWEEHEALERGWQKASGNILPPLQDSVPPQYEMSEAPILVSVDVESNEVRHSQITEIGISWLDTLDLVNTPPGENGKTWRLLIKTRHLRIQENRHVTNHRFLVGCPDKFLFGESEVIPMSDIVDAVEALFEGLRQSNSEQHGPRKLVLVGHELEGDIKYLRQLGCNSLFEPFVNDEGEDDLKLSSAFIDRIDTNSLYRVLQRDANGTSLGTALYNLDMEGWYLHNAGNDAYYTMEVLIALALRSRVQEPKTDRPPNATFFPLVCGISNLAENAYQEEAFALAHKCDDAWKEEVSKRWLNSKNVDQGSRVRANCALWEAAIADAIFGTTTASGRPKAGW